MIMSTATRISDYNLTDFHSHCLPDMDDGAADIQTAVAMLRASAQQGVKRVVATPHFYIGQHSASGFFKERQRAYEDIRPYLTEDMPQVLLGAEVLIREGISRYDLSPFCLQDTNILLVEMPFGSWTDRIVEDVCMLTDRQGLVPVLAHVERYRQRDQFPKYWQELLASGVLFQCNAGSFLRGSQRGWMFRQLKKGLVHFLGSDCHNMTTRPPNMGLAAQVIQKKKLAVALEEIGAFSAEILHV